MLSGGRLCRFNPVFRWCSSVRVILQAGQKHNSPSFASLVDFPNCVFVHSVLFWNLWEERNDTRVNLGFKGKRYSCRYLNLWTLTYSFTEAWKCRRAEHECIKNLFRAWSHVQENWMRTRNNLFSIGEQQKHRKKEVIICSFMFFNPPLWVSSLRACLLGGELLCSLSGYSLLWALLLKTVRHLRKHRKLVINMWNKQIQFFGLFFFLVIIQAYLSVSSMGVACRDRRENKIWLNTFALITGLPNGPSTPTSVSTTFPPCLRVQRRNVIITLSCVFP